VGSSPRAQVAQHHVEADVRPYGQHVGVHQAAGGVLRVGQHVDQALAVLPVQAAQDLADHGVGQVVEDIRQVVQIQVVDGGDQVRVRGIADQAGAHLVVHLDQHVAFEFRVGQLPDGPALGDRQRFQQSGDLAGRQTPQQAPDA
jgi:hypothetical protein